MWKTIQETRAFKRFTILAVGDVEKLIKRRKEEDDPILYFVHNDELFDKIHEVHIARGHGGINKMMAHLRTRYVNVTADAVKLYISFWIEERKTLDTNS